MQICALIMPHRVLLRAPAKCDWMGLVPLEFCLCFVATHLNICLKVLHSAVEAILWRENLWKITSVFAATYFAAPFNQSSLPSTSIHLEMQTQR